MKEDKLFAADKPEELTPQKVLENSTAGVTEYRLSRKVIIADKTYEILKLDFESLSSEDMEKAASLKGSSSGDTSMNEFSKTYLMQIVALAAGITIHEVRKFPIKDGTALTILAQGFLMSGGSGIIEK